MIALYLILAGLAAVVVLALLYGRQSRKRGRAEGSSVHLEAAVAAARKSGATDEDVSRMSDADLYDELYGNGSK